MDARTVTAPVAGAARQFFAGARLLLRGLGMYARSPRLVLLGVIPALISGALFVAAYAMLIYFVGDLAELLTPFADDWVPDTRKFFRFLVVVALLGLGLLVGMLTFTAVTLLIGNPFYEKVSELVEDRFGGVSDEVDLPWWRSLGYSLVDSLRLVAQAVLIGIPLLIGGFIPLIGQTVIPVLGALVGGWLLALELVGVPFSRRGLRLPDRRRELKANRPAALGFGVAVFLCFLVPLGAVLFMPAAVAGATLLARRSLGQSIEES
ncbi:MAG TPA: EI24 domain-containing protein [Micromonosporaceae bacterium]|nr:EI24 domain-containing protein [Micromonosporaceae bacterium]